MTSAMCFMTFTLTFAGVVQTHLQRVMGMHYMEVQDQLQLFYVMRLGTGVLVAIAAVIFFISIFGPVKEQASASSSTGSSVGDGVDTTGAVAAS